MNILVAGDFCPQYRVVEMLDKGLFNEVLGELKPVIKQADYSIVNFECPVKKGNEVPIVKVGPNLHCSEKGIEAIKWAGFDCVTLANNHFLDYGTVGVNNTIDACKKYEIDTVGGGTSLEEASKVKYKDIKGKKLAVINCCEHEFSIAKEKGAGSNPLNPIRQYYEIRMAKVQADYVIIIVHGGHENFQLPSIRMQETYRFFIDAGADAVVNHHQHCFSGYEVYNDKPIFYGLGNFCFDRRRKPGDAWNEGYMVSLELGSKIEFKIYPYKQGEEEPGVKLQEEHIYDERISELNSVIANPDMLKTCLNDYYNSCYRKMEKNISPLNSRLLRSLNHRGLFPSLVTKDWLLRMRNFTMCESYMEKLEWLLINRN